MLKRITGMMTVILFLFFTLAACGSSKEGDFPAESGYTQEQLVLGSVNRFAGVVISGKETKVEKAAGKTVDEIKVSVGDTVKKGDVLFTYDGSQAEYDYEKAEVELNQMRMSLDGYATQKADLEKEKATAPASEQLSYTIQIQELDTTIRETEYKIGLKEKELEQMKEGTGDLNVVSPVNGKIKSINNDDADSDNSNDDDDMMDDFSFSDSSSGSSQPFIVITETDSFRVKAMINEENMRSLTAGDPVTIRSRVDDSTWEGTVKEVDTQNPQQDQSGFYEGDDSEMTTSSKYPFYVDLESSEGLILGQHVYVELYIEAVEPPDEEGDDSDADFSEDDFGDFTDEGSVPDTIDDTPEGDK